MEQITALSKARRKPTAYAYADWLPLLPLRLRRGEDFQLIAKSFRRVFAQWARRNGHALVFVVGYDERGEFVEVDWKPGRRKQAK